MNSIKGKCKTLALLLTIATVALVVFVQPVGAHTPPWEIPTYAYIQVFPSPIGVGQQLYIFTWLDKYPPTASGQYGDRWEDITITVWKPDGSTEVLGPFTSDPVGTVFARYTPTMTGTYQFQMHFPKQVLQGKNPPPPPGYAPGFAGTPYINDTFLESYSSKVSVVVQQQAIPAYESPPLPTGYWTRPISQELQEWTKIAANWLGLGWQMYPYGFRVTPYGAAPGSAHVVWTRPITFGGIVEGQFDYAGYYTGISYESYWTPPVVMLGRLYYNEPAPPRYGMYCVDLRTGEEIWWQNSTGPITYETWFYKEFYPQLRFGQLLSYDSPNQHGVIAYLWTTYSTVPSIPAAYGDVWQLHDAYTGNWICKINKVPGGTTILGQDGSVLTFQLNAAAHWLALWNSSRAVWEATKDIGTPGQFELNEYWMWRPRLGGTIDGSKGYSWNVTIDPSVTGSIVQVLEDRILGTSGLAGLGTIGTPPYKMWCLSLKPGEIGKLLWIRDYQPPSGNLTMYAGPASLEDGVFTIRSKETVQWWGYSLEDGRLLWGPTEPETDLHMYGVSTAVAYGRLYSADSSASGGTIYCYDLKTGNRVWKSETEALGLEGYWPRSTAILGFIADKKLYLYANEHSPGPMLWPGAKLRCLDADTGKELWKISHWGNGPVIADGYLVDLNSYDNQIYCYGKGPSAVTVEAPLTAVAKGQSVVIRGTVSDESPGAKKLVKEGKFSMVPAIADEDMSAWMEYVYMQKPCPANLKGVPVKLQAIKSDGSVVDIGTVESDAYGVFTKLWTPPSEGEYRVVATFEGSESYWGSYAETVIGVSGAAAEASNISLYLLIVILIVVLAIAAIVLLKKR